MDKLDPKEYASGDIVVLRSGGPNMVVEEWVGYKDLTGYRCLWFDDSKQVCEHVFAHEVIRLVLSKVD